MNKFIFLLLFLSVSILISCQPDKKDVETDVAFGKYVQAFTSGTISTESVISVYLAKPVSENTDANKQLFSFKPAISGKTVLVGNRIVEFRPFEPLKPNTTYEAEFHLGKLVDTEKKYKDMPFQFSTMKQSFSVTLEGLKNYESGAPDKMQFTGYLITADVSDLATTEKVLYATYNGNKMPLHWNHDSNREKHFFTVDSLLRDETNTQELIISWNGKPLNVDKKGEEKVGVPALNVFNVLEAKVLQEPEQHVEIRFSDPLQKAQDLTGLVELENQSGLKLTIEGNIVKVWPEKPLSDEINLTIFEGIENVNYAKIKEQQTFRLQFSSLKPAVRLIGKGIIVPQNETLEMPFEAVSLNAVEIYVVRIFKDNILQFFQENDFDGDSDLKKVGRLVYSGKVSLNAQHPGDLLRWNTYKINLADYMEIEQGAIYNVQFRFRKEFSLFECGDEKGERNLENAQLETKEPYQTEWDRPGWYSGYYYPPGYDWDEKDNPCHISYYNSVHFPSRNIFASELGIIAKEGQNQVMNFAVSNLLTTNPEAAVEIQLFNYQNQLLETVTTDANGFAKINMEKKPFLLVAKKGKQFGYLRLDDGSALSTSNFNVLGDVVTDGLKGFIYGERGVWRPGDTLFLNFIVEKENSALPENYPVIFQLINPNGQVVEKLVQTENTNGFYSFKVPTSNEAPTGNWQAEVKVGNAVFSKRVKIETIKPNRLKIDLKLPAKALTLNTESIPLESVWLFGSPARSLKAKVDVLFVQDNTIFKGFENYSFTDPASSFSPEEQTIFEGKLDDNGKVTVPVNFESLENAPGMVKAWFTSRVFEEGGDFSINVEQAKLAPFKTFVGVRMPASEDNWYKTDTDYSPEIILVDANGKPVSGDNLQVRLYKIDWRWWWESGSENLAHYVSGNYYRPLNTWNIEKADQKNTIKLNVKYKNWQDNGRYLLWVKDETSGHASGVTFYMSKWGSWRSEGMADGATLLTLRTDKEKYNAGEKIEVTIPSSKAGKALVSLENGTEVMDWFWVKTQDKQTHFTIEAKPEMAPNFYIHVSLLQPYGQTENDAPLRLYGVISVPVENPETILKPVIETPVEIEPEKKYTVKVSEANKKEMTYTLAIVDEGLLELTNFKTPDPHAAFYAREALGVKTWDLYDVVAGAYGARLEKAFAVGGDADLANKGKKEINRFKPVVQFAGPFTLKKGQTNKHEFTMPNYVGAVRVMVVAGNNGAYGNVEKEVPVRKGLMLLATLPRVLAPNEEVSLPVDVFAMKENVKNAVISIRTNDLVEVSDEKQTSIDFTSPGEKMVWFNLKTKSETGIAKIEIDAKSGKEMATYEVELEIRNPNSAVTIERSAVVDGMKSWSEELTVPGVPEDAQSWVEISGFPPLNLNKHLEYLMLYPHGCVEQVTSAAFPQLFLGDLTKLSAGEKQQTENNIRSALQKLPAFQLDNGGLGYWPGAVMVNEWGTNYAGHFMLEAENEGYSLPIGLKEKWINFQRTAARNWNSSTGYRNGVYYRGYDFIQAYRLYTLALAGSPDLGAMNRLREKGKKSAEVAWRLAAAYVLAGQPEAARELINGVTRDVADYNGLGETFGSALRDRAMILETMILLNDKEEAFRMLQNISDEINKSDWLSTQTAAWCLSSAGAFAHDFYKGSPETQFELNTNGEKHILRTEIPVVTFPVKVKQDGKITVNFKNKGQNTNSVRVFARGIPVGVDSTSVSKNIILDVKYISSGNREVNPKTLTQGQDFKMVVTVKNPGKIRDYEEIVLNTVFPSGWEIINKRLNDIPQDQNSTFEYQDIRDDRIYTYFDLAMNEQKTFTFYLNAAYAGRFYQPPVSCEAMYDNSIRAQRSGSWVEVKK